MIASFDFLWLSACVGIGAACVISYLLGRWHGLNAALSYRFPDQVPGDWPAALHGDLPSIPVVHGPES